MLQRKMISIQTENSNRPAVCWLHGVGIDLKKRFAKLLFECTKKGTPAYTLINLKPL